MCLFVFNCGFRGVPIIFLGSLGSHLKKTLPFWPICKLLIVILVFSLHFTLIISDWHFLGWGGVGVKVQYNHPHTFLCTYIPVGLPYETASHLTLPKEHEVNNFSWSANKALDAAYKCHHVICLDNNWDPAKEFSVYSTGLLTCWGSVIQVLHYVDHA